MKNKVSRLLEKLAPTAMQLLAIVAVLGALIVGYNLGSSGTVSPETRTVATSPSMVRSEEHSHAAPRHPIDLNGDGIIFTCSMHPQIKQDEPGDCPICGMDLVPAEIGELSGEGSDTPAPQRRMTMSPEAKALASVQTAAVERRSAHRVVRMVGTLAVDPSRRVHISADVGGRIDELYAEFEGDYVEQGQSLVLLYSPELLAVQQEFLQAVRALERLAADAPANLRQASEAAVRSSRERLRLAGMQPGQIDEIRERGEATEQITLKSPAAGWVLQRHAEEGMYVRKGEMILALADLSLLWVEFDAYESDLPWLRVGQPVEFDAKAFPGETFKGEITYIDPTLKPATRTVRVRANAENPEGKLRPAMYVTGRVRSRIEGEPLVIPASAPLLTGKRAVVYVEVPDADRPTFEGREVVLGPRTNEGYIVEDGLSPGERVVVNGAFQIDSAMQIQAKPSMMSPQGGTGGMAAHQHGESPAVAESAKQRPHFDLPKIEPSQIEPIVDAYLRLQRALAGDDHSGAAASYRQLAEALDGTGLQDLHDMAEHGGHAEDIQAARQVFEGVSEMTIALVRQNGAPLPLYVAFCPMAFNNEGAEWLQADRSIANPYFGSAMHRCGAIVEKVEAQ